MQHPPPFTAHGTVINRLSDLMAHCDRYMFHGVTRFAEDAGVSPSTVSRFISREINPTFALVEKITNAAERALGHRIDPRDIVSLNGQFLTRFSCDLTRCSGCLPELARDEFGDVLPAFHGIEPGRWVTSRYPLGFDPKKGDL